MRIEGVVISCYRFDLHLTRLCVASVRFWYPEIPIWLLKDRHSGDFSTVEIEQYWNVKVYPTRQKTQGWGFGKLEVMTELPARRLLLLDSDTVFAGRVIDRLQLFDEDVIVAKEDFDATAVEVQFFSIDRLRQLDSSFEFPGYGFNGGQIVATTGRLRTQDFEGLLNWQARTVEHPDIFKKGDQGLSNYVVLRKVQRGQLSLQRQPFMAWPGQPARTAHIHVHELTLDSPHSEVIHWAGLSWGTPLEEMPRSDILLHFEHLYYSRIPHGTWLRGWRRAQRAAERSIVTPLKAAARRVLRRSPRAFLWFHIKLDEIRDLSRSSTPPKCGRYFFRRTRIHSCSHE